MTPNQQITEGMAILGSIDPSSQAVGTLSTAFVPAQNFHSFLAQIKTGVFGALATVDATIQQATDALGTGAKPVVGKAITQLTAAGGNNRQALINFKAADLDGNNGFAFVRLVVTVGTAATFTDGTLYGFNPRFEPVRDLAANPPVNLGVATIAQIV